MGTGKFKKKSEDPDELFSRTLELYTLVPPSPLVLKKKIRSWNKKSKTRTKKT